MSTELLAHRLEGEGAPVLLLHVKVGIVFLRSTGFVPNTCILIPTALWAAQNAPLCARRNASSEQTNRSIGNVDIQIIMSTQYSQR